MKIYLQTSKNRSIGYLPKLYPNRFLFDKDYQLSDRVAIVLSLEANTIWYFCLCCHENIWPQSYLSEVKAFVFRRHVDIIFLQFRFTHQNADIELQNLQLKPSSKLRLNFNICLIYSNLACIYNFGSLIPIPPKNLCCLLNRHFS